MPSDERPNHAARRLSARLATSLSPLLPASSSSNNANTANNTANSPSSPSPSPSSTNIAAAAAIALPQSRPGSTTFNNSTARNSVNTMGYPIYEPQSQRPYTPDPADAEEGANVSEEPPLAGPAPPSLPEPAYFDIPIPPTATTTTAPPDPQPQPQPPAAAAAPPSPTPKPKPSFQSSHRTLSLTSSFTPSHYPATPSQTHNHTTSKPNNVYHSTTTTLASPHTSNNPSSPFYTHPPTATCLSIDRADLKAWAPSCSSKTAIVKVVPQSTSSLGTTQSNTYNGDIESGQQRGGRFGNAGLPPTGQRSRRSLFNPWRRSAANNNNAQTNRLSKHNQHNRTRTTSHPLPYYTTTTTRPSLSTPHSRTATTTSLPRLSQQTTNPRPSMATYSGVRPPLLQRETHRRVHGRRGLRRWWRVELSARQRLVVKLLLGFLVVGGVVGIVVGLWWRFARLGGSVG